MTTVLIVLHVIVCFLLIAVVLLQRGKGAEMGAVFGGGASSTVFGSRGAGNFLTKLTTGSAIIFMVTSFSLSYIMTRQSGERLFDGEIEIEAEALVEEGLFDDDLGTVAPESASEAEDTNPLDPVAEDTGDAPTP